MAEERPAVGERAQLVDRHDARMLQLAADLRLLDEPADQVGVVAVVLAEHLDRDLAAATRRRCAVHGPDPAAAISAPSTPPAAVARGKRGGRRIMDGRGVRVGDEDAVACSTGGAEKLGGFSSGIGHLPDRSAIGLDTALRFSLRSRSRLRTVGGPTPGIHAPAQG